MDLPDGVTQEWIDEQLKNFDPGTHFTNPKQIEEYKSFYVVDLWLGEQLHKVDCPRLISEKIRFGFGQYCHYEDHWVVAQRMLKNWVEKQEYEQPGSELARKLLNKYGFPPHMREYLKQAQQELGLADELTLDNLSAIKEFMAKRLRETEVP